MDSRWLETLVMSAAVHVILNPLAGTHARAPEHLPQQLDALFKAQGISPRIALARSGAEVRTLAWRAVRERSQLVISGGAMAPSTPWLPRSLGQKWSSACCRSVR